MKQFLGAILLLSSFPAFSSPLHCEGLAMTVFYQSELEPDKEKIQVEINNIKSKSVTVNFNQSARFRLNEVGSGYSQNFPYKNFTVNTDKFGSYISMSIPKDLLEGGVSNKRVLISKSINNQQYDLVQSTTISLKCSY